MDRDERLRVAFHRDGGTRSSAASRKPATPSTSGRGICRRSGASTCASTASTATMFACAALLSTPTSQAADANRDRRGDGTSRTPDLITQLAGRTSGEVGLRGGRHGYHIPRIARRDDHELLYILEEIERRKNSTSTTQAWPPARLTATATSAKRGGEAAWRSPLRSRMAILDLLFTNHADADVVAIPRHGADDVRSAGPSPRIRPRCRDVQPIIRCRSSRRHPGSTASPASPPPLGRHRAAREVAASRAANPDQPASRHWRTTC